MAIIELLSFDTKLFGFKTGVINLGHVEVMPNELAGLLEDARGEGYRLIYVKYMAPNELEVKLSNTEVYNDTKLTFSMTVGPLSAQPIDSAIKDYKAHGDIDSALYDLAYTSGQNSRFLVDKHFPSKVFTDMYDIWLEKSVNNEIASKTFVYTNDEGILGFVTLDMRADEHSRIGLIGVNSHSQGMGIGKKLINAAIVETLDNNRKQILVDTQMRNEQACKFYLKSGFELFSTEYIANCWIN